MTGSRIDAISGRRTAASASPAPCASPAACVLPAACALLAIMALTGCGGSKGSSAGTSGGPGVARSATSTPPAAPSALQSREVSHGVVRAAAHGVTATMRVSGHRPRVNAAWPVNFTVARAGKPVKAEVRYQYLFAGQVVARRSHYRFEGALHDVFRWPASAVGYPLTFRAAIVAAGVRLNLDYPIQVQKR